MMNYTKIYKGEFHIAGEENNKRFGLLKFLNGTAYIDLFGQFHSRENYKKQVQHIFGYLDNGHTCIFINCMLSPPSPFNVSNIVNFNYFIHAPSHIIAEESGENIKFNAVNFRLDYLTIWTGINAFKSFYENDKSAGVQVEAIDLKDLILIKNSNFELKVSHSFSVPLINPFSEYKLEQESWLICNIVSDSNFDQVFDFLKLIEEIFILMIGHDVKITTPIILTTSVDVEYFCYRNTKNIRLAPATNREEISKFHYPLIDLKALKEQIEPINFFRCWEVVRFKYEYATEKIIKALCNKTFNSESIFLDLVFSLEKMVEIDMPSLKLERDLTDDDEKHLTKLDDEGVLKNTIDYFRARIRKTNNIPRLKNRISKYLKKYDNYIVELVANDYYTFIDKLVDSRNHLAHLCDNCENRIKIGEYASFNKKLITVLLTVIFDKMGIQPEYMVKMLKQYERFRR